MKKIKTLLITFEFSDRSCGGDGVYAFELAKILSENGVEMHVIAASPKETRREVINDNLVIYWQKTIFKPFMRRPLFFNSIRKNYKKIIKEENIDIIHSNDYAGFLIAGKLPIITTILHPRFCEINNFGLQSMMNLLGQVMENKVLKKSDKIIAISHLTYDLLLSKYPAFKNKTNVIVVGVDINKFKKVKSDIRKKYNIKKNEILLFSPGGARQKRKGSEILFEALSKLKKEYTFKCIITGKDMDIGWGEKFRKIIKSFPLKDNLILTGEVDYDELPKYYSTSDIVVFPSLFEGFGIPTLEAMACEKPIIATKTGEAPYIITNLKNGLLIDPGDSEGLYKKIKFLIENRDIRINLGKNGRKSIEKKYSWEEIVKEYIKVYEELVK